MWQLVKTPFPASPANQNGPFRDGWSLGAAVTEGQITFLAPCAPVDVFGRAHNTGATVAHSRRRRSTRPPAP